MVNQVNNSRNDINDKNLTDTQSMPNLATLDALSHYIKASADTRQGRTIPPLESWYPEQVMDMDLIIKANGEWWHEGTLMTRQSLVGLFATVLCQEETDGIVDYFLKTPAQKWRIQVEDAPLLINNVGIVIEKGVSWLEFMTTTGDVVRLDDAHGIELRFYHRIANNSPIKEANSTEQEPQIRPYMLVRNNLQTLIGRNAFYHLTEIGTLIEKNDETMLLLQSGGKDYQLLMPV